MIVVGVSGKKQSGKTSLCNYLQAWYIKQYHDSNFTFSQNDDGTISFYDENRIQIEMRKYDKPVCKIYAFADALKEFLMNTMELTYEQCYGTESQKNSLTEYKWDKLPINIRKNYQIPKREGGPAIQPTLRRGRMTAREVLQIFGTDICRKMFDENIWVNATLKRMKSDGVQLALVSDLRFKSEIKSIVSNDGYLIRLIRNVAGKDSHPSEVDLDKFDWNTYKTRTLMIDNHEMSIHDKNQPAVDWLERIIDATEC